MKNKTQINNDPNNPLNAPIFGDMIETDGESEEEIMTPKTTIHKASASNFKELENDKLSSKKGCCCIIM